MCELKLSLAAGIKQGLTGGVPPRSLGFGLELESESLF